MTRDESAQPNGQAKRRKAYPGDAAWETIDEAMQRLEEAWRRTPLPDLGAWVPPRSDPLRLRVLQELIKADQECRWTSGIPTGVEEYLEQWPELLRQADVILDLFASECRTRAMTGALPTAQELCARAAALGVQLEPARIAGLLGDDG